MAELNEFWHGQGHICLSDPNILACSQCENLFSQLIESGGKVDFNQGLDARLITQEKAELLASMRLDMPHFALDSMKDKDNVASGIRLYVEAAKKAEKNGIGDMQGCSFLQILIPRLKKTWRGLS